MSASPSTGGTDAARAAASIVLLEPGLTAIAEGVITARETFQKMRAYALYRVTATIHFLCFFCIAMLAFDFALPALLMIVIVVMNDFSSVVVAWDNATITRTPDKWRLGQLIALSFTLGLLLAATSLVHYVVGRYALHYSPAQLSTLLFLQLSAYPHTMILSTRIPGPWYSRRPPLLFFVLTVGTTAVVAVLCGMGWATERIGWGAVAVVVAGSVLFVVLVGPGKGVGLSTLVGLASLVHLPGGAGRADAGGGASRGGGQAGEEEAAAGGARDMGGEGVEGDEGREEGEAAGSGFRRRMRGSRTGRRIGGAGRGRGRPRRRRR